jgi:ribosomal protein S18 acetylase RimI-like enzyme
MRLGQKPFKAAISAVHQWLMSLVPTSDTVSGACIGSERNVRRPVSHSLRLAGKKDTVARRAFTIRPSLPADAAAIWVVIEPVIRAGETYPLPRDMTREDALAYWHRPEHEVFVADDGGDIVGTYYLRANSRAGGGHVANCGYMTAPGAAGRGVGRAMCMHSLARAKACGFRAMQFNLVISTNAPAVHLWQSCGFAIAGRLPGAFQHPVHGYVDALVMYRTL